MIMLLIFVIENLFWRAEDKAHLTSEDGLRIHDSEILHLNSTQEESNTQIQITALCNTKTGSKKRLLNITILAQSLSHAQSIALMWVHTFSGCDTRSLKGNEKMKPLKILQKYPQ